MEELLKQHAKKKKAQSPRSGKIKLVVNEKTAVYELHADLIGRKCLPSRKQPPGMCYKNYYESLWPRSVVDNRCRLTNSRGSKECEARDPDDLCLYGFEPQIEEEEEECARVYRRDDGETVSSEDYERLSMLDGSLHDYIDHKDLDNVFVQKPYRTPKVPVLPLDQHLHAIECDRILREKLANDFIQRDFPWYMAVPTYERDFIITEEQQYIFCDPFEFEILRNIYIYRTRFIIVFNSIDVPLGNFERWLKFKLYVAVIIVVQSKDRLQQLEHSACFHGVTLCEEVDDNLWQDELSRGLKAGIQVAKSLHVYQGHGVPFVYVFPNHRDVCEVDNFKVLRHN